MPAYVRTGRRTAISVPFWIAIPVYALWGGVMLLVLLGLAVLMLGRLALAGWRWARSRGDGGGTPDGPSADRDAIADADTIARDSCAGDTTSPPTSKPTGLRLVR